MRVAGYGGRSGATSGVGLELARELARHPGVSLCVECMYLCWWMGF
jgi:hypothetical protein|eukprot:COSAG01_NODE_3506_length_5991_cov_16.426680_4_plen_46_part_00